MDWYLATEDALSETVGESLIAQADTAGSIVVRMGKQGNGFLRANLHKFLDISRQYPLLLLTDLDRVDCPPALLAGWLGTQQPPAGLGFRVVVRAIESWVMADRSAFAEFSGVSERRLPANPDGEEDPKRTLLNLVHRYGRRAIKADLLPAPRSGVPIGLGYNAALCGFVREAWSLDAAARRSESLGRALGRLGEFAAAGGAVD